MKQTTLAEILKHPHPELNWLAVAFGTINEAHHDELIADSAEALRVSPSTIRRWICEGAPEARLQKISEMSGVQIRVLIQPSKNFIRAIEERYWDQYVAAWGAWSRSPAGQVAMANAR